MTRKTDTNRLHDVAAVLQRLVDAVDRWDRGITARFWRTLGATRWATAGARRWSNARTSRHLRAAINASTDVIMLIDPESLQYVDTNDAATHLLGYSRHEILSMGPSDLSARSPDELRASYDTLISSGVKSVPNEVEMVHKDGSTIPVEVSWRPLRSAGKWLIISVARDVSEAKRAALAFARNEARYHKLFDLNPLPMWVYDLETLAFLAVNAAAIEHYGFTREEFSAMTILDVRPGKDATAVRATVAEDRADFARSGVWSHRKKSGAIINVEITSHKVDFSGRRARLVLANDVTARLAAETALRASNDRFEVLAHATSDIVWDLDLVTGTRWWNENMTLLLGYERASIPDGAAWWGVHPDDRNRVETGLRVAMASDASTWADEYRFRHSDGNYLDIHDRASIMRDAGGTPTRMIGAMMDVTERKRAAEELKHHLTHDRTTGLPHLALFEEYLQSVLAVAAARDTRVVVLYVDLDYFHAVNQTRGRAIGDEVLRTVAGRLTAAVGTNGRVAHVAGDEFALVELCAEGGDPVDLAEAVRAMVAEPIEVAGQTIYSTCSIGISCFPDNATTPRELLRQSEAVMMRAKREGRNAVSAFSNDANDELRDRLALGARLNDAIRDGQLLLHFQPQIDAMNWQILGFEALVRWEDPELGLLMPTRFIQAAEELGIIVELGRFVLTEACRQTRAWLDAGVSDFSVAINLSPLQLQRPNFVADVRATLERFQVPPRCIELELTESVMLDNVDRMIESMRALKSLGVRLALDDFGKGYSSLNYLRRFPIDSLKIDQSFVSDVTSDAGSAGVCRAIITLGHQLGMQVMAEGVETAAQVGYLKRNGCDFFQGYYFSKPVTAERALEMLRNRSVAVEEVCEDGQVNTLLLVDDETNILNALSRTLRRDGYRILTATCADDALDILGREDVHVIVSDQRMPGSSGTEFLRKVKDIYPESMRIVLSGYTDLDAVTEAINQGAVYKFLTKPWNDEDLRMQIRGAFRRHKSHVSARDQSNHDMSAGTSPS